MNAAVTVVAAESVTVHAPVPLQDAPVHPPKLLGLVAAPVRTTLVPAGKLALHVPVPLPPATVQAIPAGTLVTLPLPFPAGVTVRLTC